MFRFIDEKNKSIRLLKGGLDSKTQYAVNRFERRNMSTSKLHVKIRNTHSHLSLHAHALTCEKHYQIPMLQMDAVTNGTDHFTLHTFKPYFVRPKEFAV